MVVSDKLNNERLAWAIKEALTHETVQQIAEAAADMNARLHLEGNGEIFAWGFAAGYHYFTAWYEKRAILEEGADISAGNASAMAAFLGRTGGKVMSKAKTRAARKNGKKGGRPRKGEQADGQHD